MSNSGNNHRRSALPEHLLNASKGRTASPLRRLLNRSGSQSQVRRLPDSNPDRLADWILSVKKRALAALSKDEELEDQISHELELQKKRKEEAESEETPLKAFNALGNILFGIYSANRSEAQEEDKSRLDYNVSVYLKYLLEWDLTRLKARTTIIHCKSSCSAQQPRDPI